MIGYFILAGTQSVADAASVDEDDDVRAKEFKKKMLDRYRELGSQ